MAALPWAVGGGLMSLVLSASEPRGEVAMGSSHMLMWLHASEAVLGGWVRTAEDGML